MLLLHAANSTLVMRGQTGLNGTFKNEHLALRYHILRAPALNFKPVR